MSRGEQAIHPSNVRLPLLIVALALAATIPVCWDMAGDVVRTPAERIFILIPGAVAFPAGLFLVFAYVVPAFWTSTSWTIGMYLMWPVSWGVYAVIFNVLRRTEHATVYWRAVALLCVLLALNVTGCYAPEVFNR
jgi:hypothetical protein